MLWLGIYFPELAIDALMRANESAGLSAGKRSAERKHSLADTQEAAPVNASLALLNQSALAVADISKTTSVIYAVNRTSLAQGIRPGMTASSAKALDANLIVLTREVSKERQRLLRIADALAQFSPTISIHDDIDRATLVVEIARSFKLFGGSDVLMARIERVVRSHAAEAGFGIAPAPLAAEVFARASAAKRSTIHCLTEQAMLAQLKSVTVSYFCWPASTQRSLETLGLNTFGDVLRQPSAGLEKRFGHDFVRDIEKATGSLADVRTLHQLPKFYEQETDIGFEAIAADVLLPFMEALLNDLEYYLRGRGAAVNAVRFVLKQTRSQCVVFDVQSRSYTRCAAHWLSLIKERLQVNALESGCHAIVLHAENFATIADENLGLLSQDKPQRERSAALLDRIATRIGAHNLYRIAVASDHRPELAWSTEHASPLSPQVQRMAAKQRPVWILREPRSLVEMDHQPQYNGPLTLLAGPERIDTGWWDNRPVARDYFVARNPQHELCWIFRDYRHGKRWYLHGFFS